MRIAFLGSAIKLVESPFKNTEMIAHRSDGVFIIDCPKKGGQYKHQVIKRKANKAEREFLFSTCSDSEQFFYEPKNCWVCKDCGEEIFSY